MCMLNFIHFKEYSYSSKCHCSCTRLSLTPLCYLWQRDQDELLSEMVNAGMEAVLIKVAGIGLSTKHLGKSLAQMQPLLRRLVGIIALTDNGFVTQPCLQNSLYGAHICGEGGEYETLTLDSPMFNKRINLYVLCISYHGNYSYVQRGT